MRFENTQKISEIKMSRNVRAFCPMGNDWYSGQVNICFHPDSLIPDYLEVDTFISSLDGTSLIIEDVVNTIFNYMHTEYCPVYLEVSCTANDAAHLPVTVIRRGI